MRPGVLYLSGFYGPLERALLAGGARIGFAPADFRRFGPLLERQAPRVMTTVAAPPDADGWCSLPLHAGGTIGELRSAGADPARVLVVEVSDAYPRTFGLGEVPPCTARRRDRHPGDLNRRTARAARSRREAVRGGKAIARHAVDYVSRGRPCRWASAPSPIRLRRCSPKATAGTTACTARCSPTAACGCTGRARSATPARVSTTA